MWITDQIARRVNLGKEALSRQDAQNKREILERDPVQKP